MRRAGGSERFLATVLFVDIVGSTELAGRLGDRAWKDLLSDFYDLVRRHLRQTGGRELDTAGDGLFAAFDAPGSAVECAIAVRRDVGDLGLVVRCGLHIGEVERVGRKVGGIAVHIGARVAGAAAPGEIWVTGTVRDIAAGSSFDFEERGEHALKGIAEPWRLYAVATDVPAQAAGQLGDRSNAPAAPLAPLRRRRRSAWRRHPRAATTLVVAAVIGALTGVYLLTSAPPILTAVEPNSVGVIDPGRTALTGQIQVGSQPSALAFGEGSLWVANSAGGTVSRIDPLRLVTVDTIQVGAAPEGIAVGLGYVWVANSGSGTVSQINPQSNTVVRTIPVGNGPVDVALAGDSVWAVNLIDGTVTRVLSLTGQVAAVIEVGATPTSGVGDDSSGSVWVTNRDAGSVTRVDIAAGASAESVNVGTRPDAIAIGHDSLWVANSGDATVSRIDVQSHRVVDTIVVPPQPTGIAASAEAIWVASSLDGSVSRIDPLSGAVVGTIRAVSAPERIAAAEGRIWFTNRATTASHRDGTLRVVLPGALDVPFSVDPQLGFSLPEWAVTSASYNGLVGFRRVAGAGGSTLVADLAESLPEPSDGGMTYVFRHREGIVYSDGTPLHAADFRHAIERGFELPALLEEATAPVFYEGIVGADVCLEAIGTDTDCDLSQGIEVDDGARMVTFHLTRSDPEFLYKLALPLAFAVPTTVPSEKLSTGIPGTGPYIIAEQTATAVRLVRNPRFSVWSPDARPDGYPDEIVWSIGAEVNAAVDQVAGGEADVLARRPPPERLEELATRFTNQIHIRPNGTMFAFLDTTRAPFDDVRVRQALNYAVDRQQIVELAGGSLQASVTCQIIQPNFQGYRRQCPYTINAGSGVWTGPDRVRALELIEEAGAAGAEVTVWAFEGGGGGSFPAVAEYLGTVLSGLGLVPSVSIVPQDEFFPGIFRPEREANAAPLTWFPDYPAASSFIVTNFACEGLANASRFCDPLLDERMQEAVDLHVSDPIAAGAIWADLDLELTEAAAWVPLVTFNETYFVSERVGNAQLHPQWGLLVDQLWVQ